MRGVKIVWGPYKGKYCPIGWKSLYTSRPLIDLGNGQAGTPPYDWTSADGSDTESLPIVDIPEDAELFGTAPVQYYQELNSGWFPTPENTTLPEPPKMTSKPFKCLSCNQALDSRDNALNPKTGSIFGCWKCGSKRLEAKEELWDSGIITKQGLAALNEQISRHYRAITGTEICTCSHIEAMHNQSLANSICSKCPCSSFQEKS